MSRKLRPLAALAMVALIGAGCSHAPAENGTASGGGNKNATNRDRAVKFAECMRDNGVSEFPDPDASGQLTIDGVVNARRWTRAPRRGRRPSAPVSTCSHRGSRAASGASRSSRRPSSSPSASVTTA
jgi:hypothetical protein